MANYSTIPESIEATWQSKILDNDIGYLKLGTFAIWKFQLDWKRFLKEAFAQYQRQKVTNLIIDIRGNEGGAEEVIGELQKYILKSDCKVGGFEERLRYDYVSDNLKPYLSTWDESVYDLRGRVKRNENGFYSFTSNQTNSSTYKKSNKAFRGNIFLLTDASNSSATFYLAKIAKDCGVAILVGETTGGSQKGINGGTIFFLRLPNTKIEVDIPIYGQFKDNAVDQGISPDIEIPRTLKGIKEGSDEQLEGLIKQITKR